MLLLSFRPGTNVKARGWIVGFIGDGQWRIVVSFPLAGGNSGSQPVQRALAHRQSPWRKPGQADA
jgi:hypothetical protein